MSAMRPKVMHGHKQVMRPEMKHKVSKRVRELIEIFDCICLQAPISSQQSKRPVDHGAGVEFTAVTARACSGAAGSLYWFPFTLGGFMRKKANGGDGL